MNKKETLEENLKFPIIIENGLDYLNLTTKIFNNGAKWQQERMFELVEEYNQMLIDPNVHEDHKEKSFKEWFQQFKNK
jgi:hypothetical protein